MVEITLDNMLQGGIYDHLAGGIYRYSVDNNWLLPHFEKMIYNQALFTKAVLEAYQISGNEKYAKAARANLDYVIKVQN